jgi:hypothetical protein
VPTIIKKKKTTSRKNLFFGGILKATEEKSRIRIRIPVVRKYGSADLNVMDPEHCEEVLDILAKHIFF